MQINEGEGELCSTLIASGSAADSELLDRLLGFKKTEMERQAAKEKLRRLLREEISNANKVCPGLDETTDAKVSWRRLAL